VRHGANDERPDGHGRTWIEGDRVIARRVARPLREFMLVETAGSVMLLAATVIALVVANSPAGDAVSSFWEEELTLISINDFHLTESLADWVNDGLMAIFFFVVGVEIKREVVDGELRDPRRAALPAIAAVGGMAVPALIYAAFNAGGDGSSGWGVPMATDIAFAVGVMTLLGSRVPSPLKVFLLSLAIADDLGAIIVIAIFYSSGVSFGWLAIAAALLAAVVALRLLHVWYLPLYVVVGIAVWVAMLESGVHATIAGVALGLLAPARPLRPRATEVAVEPASGWHEIRTVVFDAKETVSVAERLQHTVHPWSAFVILPIFAFANAGIELSAEGLRQAATSPVTVGVVVGLVVGKPVGIMLASYLAVRAGIGTLPRGVSWRFVLGASTLAGIGFTVALFITGLAFESPVLGDEARIGVLVASVIAATGGMFVLRRAVEE
jgi:NhaA family Na+:H+ antiporter